MTQNIDFSQVFQLSQVFWATLSKTAQTIQCLPKNLEKLEDLRKINVLGDLDLDLPGIPGIYKVFVGFFVSLYTPGPG